MTILFQSAQFIPIPQDYQPLTTCFYLQLTLPQENVPLHLLAQKCGLQHQTILSLQPLLLLNGNLRNTSYMKRYTIVNSSNILHILSKILWVLVFCNWVYFYVYFLFVFFLSCAYHIFSGIKMHSTVLFCFVFLLYLINYFLLLFFLFIFCSNISWPPKQLRLSTSDNWDHWCVWHVQCPFLSGLAKKLVDVSGDPREHHCGSTNVFPWLGPGETLPAYWPVCRFDLILPFPFLVAFNVLTTIAACHLPLYECVAVAFRILILSIRFIVPSVVQCWVLPCALVKYWNILSTAQPMMRVQCGVVLSSTLLETSQVFGKKNILNYTKFLQSINFDPLICLCTQACGFICRFSSPCSCFVSLTVLIWPQTIVFQHFSKRDKQGWLTRSGVLKLLVLWSPSMKRLTIIYRAPQ